MHPVPLSGKVAEVSGFGSVSLMSPSRGGSRCAWESSDWG